MSDPKKTAPKEKDPEEKNENLPLNILKSEYVVNLAEPAEIINDDTKAREVMRLLEKNKVLLVARKYEICGFITPVSALKAILEKDLEKLTAYDMKGPVQAVAAEKRLIDCISLMASQGTDILTVESKKSLIGVITAEKILDYLRKGFTKETFHEEEMIETKIDDFIRLLKRGPIKIKDAKSRLGASQDQIDEWIEILENQKVMKIEKHFGKLKVKDERNI